MTILPEGRKRPNGFFGIKPVLEIWQAKYKPAGKFSPVNFKQIV